MPLRPSMTAEVRTGLTDAGYELFDPLQHTPVESLREAPRPALCDPVDRLPAEELCALAARSAFRLIQGGLR
jgi:hypothetical protein